MVIAGGAIHDVLVFHFSVRFNGAGDGDRRRAWAAVGASAGLHPASTEPAMVIAGGRNRPRRWPSAGACFNGAGDGDRRRDVARLLIECVKKIALQRSRRW